jgi:putative membrane protein
MEGREPDYRFSLANERTFLAWIRTALAVLAGGVLLHQFATRIQPRWVLVAVAIALALLAGLMAGTAYYRWKTHEIAMRHAQPLPTSNLLLLLSVAICCVAGVLGLLLLFQ